MGMYLSCFYNLPSFYCSIAFVFFHFLTLNAMKSVIFTMRKNKKASKLIWSREIMFEHLSLDRTPKQFSSIHFLQKISIVNLITYGLALISFILLLVTMLIYWRNWMELKSLEVLSMAGWSNIIFLTVPVWSIFTLHCKYHCFIISFKVRKRKIQKQ